ncbi:MAG: hypothetical protein ACTIA6_18445 [Pseudoclavibacter sp.]
MHPAKRGRRAISAVMLVLLGFGTAIGASGCTAQETTPPATPSTTPASTEPVLPTNEEALAIVEELVAAAIAAEAKAGATGNFAELEALAGPEYVAEARAGVDELSAQSLSVSGESRVDSLSIQSISRDGVAVVIAAYGCYDITATQLLDASGNSVRSADVPVRVPVVFRVHSDASSYRLMETSSWPGSNSC